MKIRNFLINPGFWILLALVFTTIMYFAGRLDTNSSVSDFDIEDDIATIEFYYKAYHENIPPGFINATRLNNFRKWLRQDCVVESDMITDEAIREWVKKLRKEKIKGDKNN